MTILIQYTFRTDGDFSLNTPEEFECTTNDAPRYEGAKIVKADSLQSARIEATTFLKRLLCDGIHVSYTHEWLILDIYNIIQELISFIHSNTTGAHNVYLTGNYDGTVITVAMTN